MKQLTIVLSFVMLSAACTTADLQQIAGAVLGTPLTTEEIGQGLRQALEVGISKGAERLAQRNGYYESPYKILLPAEARKVTDRLQSIPGFSQLEENILEKINRGAEDAATRAKPIFVSAIKAMTIRDALGILKGEKDAATAYLRRVTYQQLYDEFNPVIVSSLDKFKARSTWADAVNTYNAIPLVREKADPDLDDYVTRKALGGLFSQVAQEELNIRDNVSARTTDLLRRVFAEQD